MGVPSFYRWLAEKYPKIVVDAVETTEEKNGAPAKNPNGREFDNLYLDMNGIIHPCFHPEHDDVITRLLNSPETYEEVFSNIFEYIDRIMMIVRPRKLLYLAIDGVAPRAKMNHQRSRRFKTAKDHETLVKEEDRLRRQFESEGRDVLPRKETEVSDSNVITPGTTFMFELSKQLQRYVHLRISKNPAWKHLKVILSDANAPGEGEHKIMSFIRLQRTCPGYNPNTSHVLYGLDADLIMLALATHEIYFSILRENVAVKDKSRTSHSSVKSRGWFQQFDLNKGLKDTTEEMKSLEISNVSKQKSLVKKPHQSIEVMARYMLVLDETSSNISYGTIFLYRLFLHVWILREYLNLHLRSENRPEKFEYDIERLIDDFICICFFGGNDFLPHMPTLEIHEGAIDLLIYVYKQEFKNLGGYLVDTQKINDKKGGYIKLKRVEKFILAVGAYEDQIFKKRSAIRDSKLRRMQLETEENNGNGEEELFPAIRSNHNPKSSSVVSNAHFLDPQNSPDLDYETVENTKVLMEKLKSYTHKTSDIFRNGLTSDMVKLGSPGWRQRYYKYKFSAETDVEMENTRKKVVQKYTEGLCWVLRYYFSGVPSWTWFYPYHYGPFASDFKGLSNTKVMFQRGSPFKPFDQLMAVLPSMSAQALPLQYQSLMTADDSSILDFYPDDFDVDTDGKRFLWQGICKLPFIEEDRLLSETKKIEKELNKEEAERNAENADKLFLHSSENLSLWIISSFNESRAIQQNSSIKIDTSLSEDINGFVHPNPGSKNVGDSSGLANEHDVLCVYYDPPTFSLHIPRVLEGTNIPEPVVTEADIVDGPLWHESRSYPSRINNRSHGQKAEEAKINPSVGYACGWRGRGRGSASHHEATRMPKDQMNSGSWWNTHGRGARKSGNADNQSTSYNSRTNNVNGQIWSVRSDSGYNSNQPRGRGQ
ncbi:hypothetical protein LXL04_022850 [Taraxacum kok-saghyz]